MLTLDRWLVSMGEDGLKEARQQVAAGNVLSAAQTSNGAEVIVRDAPAPVKFDPAGYALCGCPFFTARSTCTHVLQAALYLRQRGIWDQVQRKYGLAHGGQLLSVIEASRPETTTLRLEVTLHFDLRGSSCTLRTGVERLYVVKSIPDLLDALDQKTPLEFARSFTLEPSWMHYTPEDQQILNCLRHYWQNGSLSPRPKTAERSTPLTDFMLSELLEALSGTDFILKYDRQEAHQHGIQEEPLPLDFRVTGSIREISIEANWGKNLDKLTNDWGWAMVDDRIVRVPKAQRAVLKALDQSSQRWYDGEMLYVYPERDTPAVIEELLPLLRQAGTVDVDAEIRRRLVQEPLRAEVYLDLDGTDMIARTDFVYGNRRINPFSAEPRFEEPRQRVYLQRDVASERRVLDILGEAGFQVSGDRVYLRRAEAQYAFITRGIHTLQEVAEVFLSHDFSRVTPRRLSMKAMMRLNGGSLELTFPDDEATPELLQIMEALNRHQRYYRLKSGAFIDLTSMEDWEPLAASVSEASEAKIESHDGQQTLVLSSYRAFYLHSLLAAGSLPVEEDTGLAATLAGDSLADETVALPDGLSLRSYQQRGFHWLMTLDRLRMGGVLADDMGLGKTVQIIALLKTTRQSGKPSLIVAPSSLVYNWLNELNRFAPELSVMVLSGTAAQRSAQITHTREAGDIDVLITSYPLIRRDIDQLREMSFRVAVLDEAQNIKNAASIGAKAVKQLRAESRFALTGTPLENGTGELWSVFDFVLPGYLFSYHAFIHRYQEADSLDDLRRRIRPFLLRRLKHDVLSDLPDKTETRMTAQMTPEQEKVYQASLLRMRDRVQRVMDEKGMQRGRVEILSAITEMRQICCHPALVMPDYTGSSGKVELLLDILPSAMAAGRRLLIFSQFTSMLRLLRLRLEESGYVCLYLDGQTPVDQRLQLTERFNGGEGQIFLISLKAGGTGLNLTGADMVIHYDPWWNPAAEDQATDRAHRIGQTHKVDVVRLVTHGTIEEQVVRLGERKKALFDQLITPGEELVTALSERDIRELFKL